MSYIWPENQPDARHIKFPQIAERECWPKAPSKFVCVFEAIDWAGPVACPGEWSGKELLSVSWSVSPLARREHDRLAPPQGMKLQYDGQSGKVKPARGTQLKQEEHVRDWHAERRQRLWEENGRAQVRLDNAVEWLAQRCRDGELASYARLVEGSEMMKLAAHEWNVDHPFDVFVQNGGPCRSFFQYNYSHKARSSYLFFDRAELQGVLSRQPDSPLIVGKADLSRLSPYLRLAVHVALQRHYFDRESCDTKDVREAEIEGAWSGFIPEVAPVKSTVQQLAKLMTFPDPEAIGQGQKGAQSRKTGGTPKQ